MHCYTKITKYNPCTQNIIIHTLPSSQADCFSNKEIKEIITWPICTKKCRRSIFKRLNNAIPRKLQFC